MCVCVCDVVAFTCHGAKTLIADNPMVFPSASSKDSVVQLLKRSCEGLGGHQDSNVNSPLCQHTWT